MRFSEVAGTSAGAIVAALIGAGADPAFLGDTLKKLDFMELLAPPENEGSFNGAGLKAVGVAAIGAGIFSSTAGQFGRVLKSGGLYSSRRLEDWLDEKLQKLLKLDRPVLFRDLLVPTHVVATDFGRQRERLWDRDVSPDAKVAFAARASSSIPFFFQAVVEGNDRLVDGGILSNLPAFVFAEEHRRSGKPILTFRLQAQPTAAADWSFLELIKRLVDTSISGASEIQLGLVQGASHIDIPTGDIRATDFDRMDDAARTMLFRNGQDAATHFIESEAIRLGPPAGAESRFWNPDRLYLEVVRQSAQPAAEIILAQRDTEWYWQLFPTVLHWRLNGMRVRARAGGTSPAWASSCRRSPSCRSPRSCSAATRRSRARRSCRPAAATSTIRSGSCTPATRISRRSARSASGSMPLSPQRLPQRRTRRRSRSSTPTSSARCCARASRNTRKAR